ncbi:MAG: hypothetical protein K8I60_18875 [Anaerolineae bacterium]|nr:hypothetical protein [Anaerolineae bacterium]
MLDLNITGSLVEPPSEATATPVPTDTPTPFQGVASGVTRQPTLVNVTANPLVTQAVPVQSESSDSSLPLILAVTVMLIGGIGFVIVLLIAWRSRRR